MRLVRPYFVYYAPKCDNLGFGVRLDQLAIKPIEPLSAKKFTFFSLRGRNVLGGRGWSCSLLRGFYLTLRLVIGVIGIPLS